MRAFAFGVVLVAYAGFSEPVSAQAVDPASATSTAVSGFTTPKRIVNIDDPTGISAASLTGDQDKLGYIASTTSNGPDIVAKALQQRSLYQLELSSKTVHGCTDANMASLSPASVQCTFILAGNRLLQNDIAAWAKLMQQNKTLAYPMYVQQAGKLLHQDPSTLRLSEFDVSPDYHAFLNVPAVVVSRHEKSFDIALKQESALQGEHGDVYTVTATVNGQPLQMLFDTGASTVLLGADEAKRLHVEPLYPNWLQLPDGTYTSLGIVKQLELGGITISNLPVAVSDKPLKWHAVLGLSAMQYLDAFLIQGNTLQSTADGTAGCTTPMDMASHINGTDHVFVVRGTVDGKPFPFVISTGVPGAISRSHYGQPDGSVQAKPYTAHSAFGNEYAWYSSRHANMQIGNAPGQNQPYDEIYHAGHTRFRYYVGADYIAQHGLMMDFKRSVLCLK